MPCVLVPPLNFGREVSLDPPGEVGCYYPWGQGAVSCHRGLDRRPDMVHVSHLSYIVSDRGIFREVGGFLGQLICLLIAMDTCMGPHLGQSGGGASKDSGQKVFSNGLKDLLVGTFLDRVGVMDKSPNEMETTKAISVDGDGVCWRCSC